MSATVEPAKVEAATPEALPAGKYKALPVDAGNIGWFVSFARSDGHHAQADWLIKYIAMRRGIDEGNQLVINQLEATQAELLEALRKIAQLNDGAIERASEDVLFALLDIKVSIARAAVAKAAPDDGAGHCTASTTDASQVPGAGEPC